MRGNVTDAATTSLCATGLQNNPRGANGIDETILTFCLFTLDGHYPNALASQAGGSKIMRWRNLWIVVSFTLAVGSIRLQEVNARIVVGVSTVNVAFLPIYITQDKGFFKDEGLEVLVVMFNAGATNLQAMIGGDVQIMAGGVPETVLARAGGLDIKNFCAISNVMPFQIYGRPNMKSLKDGKGKKFAISRFGSLSEFLTRSALRQSGVDPKDVTMVQIGATPARFTTLASGIVDATILWFPVTERAKAAGMNKLRSEGPVSQLDQRRFCRSRDVARQGERSDHKVLAGVSARREAHTREPRRWHSSAQEIRRARRRRGGRRL